VSYGLHIIIRFELEQALFSGSLEVSELPAAWNASYQKHLNLVPRHEGEGVLQDVHWYTGNFGYFPTYLLGSAYAAQLFEAAAETLPDLREQIAEGSFLPLRSWLRERIHRHGKRFSARELIRRATGRDPAPESYLRYLESKYQR
jgi:carboxypeptidase Taq